MQLAGATKGVWQTTACKRTSVYSQEGVVSSVVMRGVTKGGVKALPVSNRTAAEHLKGVVLWGCLHGIRPRVSQQLADGTVRWLLYWRLLLSQLLLTLQRQQEL